MTGLKPARMRFSALRRLRTDENGGTAVEFAMILGPFLMLTFGIIGIGLYFFTLFSLENAVEQASREIRTGLYKTANSGSGMSTLDFKNKVCSYAPSFVDCTGKMRVSIVTILDEDAANAAATGFSGAGSRPLCVNGSGNLIPENSNAATKVTTPPSTITLVLVCYQWDLAMSIPYLKLGSMNGTGNSGAALIQAATTFRTEPFE